MATIGKGTKQQTPPLRIGTLQKLEPFIIQSEREFLALKGDFTEVVKLTYSFSERHRLNGWYVYEKTPEGINRFIRKKAGSDLIDTVVCATRCLQFDRVAGILPNSYEVDYQPVGPRSHDEFDRLKKELTDVGDWH